MLGGKEKKLAAKAENRVPEQVVRYLLTAKPVDREKEFMAMPMAREGRVERKEQIKGQEWVQDVLTIVRGSGM